VKPRHIDARTDPYFWDRVEKTEGCWIWTGARYGEYGRIRIDYRPVLAHRYVYESFIGPIDPGKGVFHHCDTPLCVRPDHLFSGTQSDNVADMIAKGRHGKYNALKTVCKNGHPFDEQNTRHRPGGGRACRTCDRLLYHYNNTR
jgi:hypothetical protein